MKKILTFIKEKTDNSYLQFIKYFFFFFLALFVDMGTLFVLTEFCKVYYIISATISFMLGIAVTYILSKMYIFTKTKIKNGFKEFVIFLVIGIIGLILNNILKWQL